MNTESAFFQGAVEFIETALIVIQAVAGVILVFVLLFLLRFIVPI